ncbi:hypothetical protein HDU93_006141 [Gonapodya sp. JEL0774]|nr:hypothetical protein HDU93_006141 [Gonapodya sp. JEL0774]
MTPANSSPHPIGPLESAISSEVPPSTQASYPETPEVGDTVPGSSPPHTELRAAASPRLRKKPRRKRKVRDKSDTEDENEIVGLPTSPTSKSLRPKQSSPSVVPKAKDDDARLLSLASSTARVSGLADVLAGEEILGSDEEGDNDYQYGEEKRPKPAKRAKKDNEIGKGHRLGSGQESLAALAPNTSTSGAPHADPLAERRRLALEAADRRAKALCGGGGASGL